MVKISEILTAIQIAKQIPSVVDAAFAQSDVRSEESGKTGCIQMKDPASVSVPREKRRKSDPLHQYRVVASVDGPAKKRSNAAGSLKEVLYPKSMQPVPDCACRSADENEVTVSKAKDMPSRKSQRGAVKESRAQDDRWTARDITNAKSQQPQADMGGAKDVTSNQCPQSQGPAKDIPSSTANQSQADVTNCKCRKSLVDVSAAKGTTNKKAQRPQAEMWTAKEITNRKCKRAQTNTPGAKSFTSSKAQLRAAPGPEQKKRLPGNEKQAPQTFRRVRGSKSPPRPVEETPKLIASSSKSLKASFTVKQGSRGPQHVRCEPTVVATSSTTATTADPAASKIEPHRSPLPEIAVVSPSRIKEPSAAVNACGVTEASLPSASDIKRCNSLISTLPRAFSSRPKGLGDVDDKASHVSAASTAMETSNAPRDNESMDAAINGSTSVRSSIPESATRSAVSTAQLKTPVKGAHQQPCPSDPPSERPRAKFIMEATEIKCRSNFWRPSQSKLSKSKAVLFSNPAFAPALPHGTGPASEDRQQPDAVASTHKSTARSTSAARRVIDRIGRAISSFSSANLTPFSNARNLTKTTVRSV